MKTRYNIYFEGQHLEGFDPADVRANLSKLFNANEKTLERLFSGSAALLKKDCDEQTAHKYQQAMERAGAVAVLRELTAEADESAAAASENTPGIPRDPADQGNTAARKLNASERIAALAAVKADPRFRTEDDEEEQGPREVEWASPRDNEGNLALTPPGTEVLLEEERPVPVEATVDTSALSVDGPADRLSEERPTPPPAPDTSHMEMGEVGDAIPNLPSEEAPIDPDISGIDLSPQGTDFTDCTPSDAEPPNLDLSGMDVAPEGSDVLEEKYRRKDDAEAPSTDHLSIQN